MRQILRCVRSAAAVVMVHAGLTVAPFASAQKRDRPTLPPAWTLVWSDEFNQSDGTAPDPTKWSIQTGGDGFGNSELEYYTRRLENAHISRGNLVITAKKESFTGSDDVTRQYTSARMQSKDKFQQQYGRFEARIKLPSGGQGLWPAFWMLGDDVDRAGWPACGEIDIMEQVGFEASIVHGSLHGPGIRARIRSPGLSLYRGASASAPISMSLPWSGSRPPSVFTWITFSTKPKLRKASQKSTGRSTIRFSFCLILLWEAVGPAAPMAQPSSPPPCWSTTCGSISGALTENRCARRSHVSVLLGV